MTPVAIHPSLRVARAFDIALDRASTQTPSSDFGCGALYALVVIADAAGMSADPRVAAILQRIAESPMRPRDGEHAA